MNRIKLILVIGGVLLTLSFAGQALAEGIRAECDGLNGSGKVYVDAALVARNSRIQVIRGLITPPTNEAGNNYLSSGNTLISNEVVGSGTDIALGAGVFYLINGSENGTYVYLRVWNATSPGSGIRYGVSPQMLATGSGQLPRDYVLSNITLNYMANKPPDANLKLYPATNIGYDGATVSWEVLPDGTPPNLAYYEVVNYTLAYSTEASGTFTEISAGSNKFYTFQRLSLLPGVTYYYKVKAMNGFGTSAFSGVKSFTTLGTNFGGTASGLKIHLSGTTVTLTWEGSAGTYEVWSSTSNGPYAKSIATAGKSFGPISVTPTAEMNFQVRVPNGQGAPETVGWLTFILSKEAGGTGVNSVAIPFDTTVSGNSPKIYTASDVATLIGSDFEFIGGWDKVAQTEFAYINGVGGPNFTIRKGEGYQISVKNNKNWTVVGQK